uniref:CCAAT enhancer binding protein zeta n=1 Tax=Hippocampus comes TaxID=109280 RepID=A0A3Q2ZBE6_HIPCM
MAAKNNHRKKSKAGKKGIHQPEENIMEEENCDDEGDMVDDGHQAEADEFNLEEVLRLGGTQADFRLLCSLDASHDLVDGGKKGTIDDLEEGELESFITKLGIRELANLQVLPDETKEEAVPNKELPKSKLEKPAVAKPSKPQQKPSEQQKKEKTPKGTAAMAVAMTKKQGKQNVFEFHQRNALLIKPGGKWYDLEYSAEGSTLSQDPGVVSSYKTLAQRLYEADVELYKTKKALQKGANSAWMKTVVSAGALADRMAAMTVLIQDAPVHMLEHVEDLVSMVKKKGSRRMSLMALDTLRELLLSDLLPENRKLRTFDQHPFDKLEELASGNRDARDRRLILWYFEHHLKHHVAQFVAALDVVAHDTVSATKTKALVTAHELLSQRPEQERALLIHLVNKLGDPEYKMAAKASHLLETLLHTKLIGIYFSFFRACVSKTEVDSKMLSALLSGVNRAYPFASKTDEKVKEQTDTLFKVVHTVKFNTAVQALMLLFQVMDDQQTTSDRYYVALYRKLLDASLSTSTRQNMFLNLLFKSLKADTVLRRIRAFIKRLLQVSAQQGPNFACAALMVISGVMRAKPELKTLLQEEEAFMDRPEEKLDDDDDEVERFADIDKMEAATTSELESKPVASWIHHQNLRGPLHKYDPLHRNPLFCCAERATLWELRRLALHFHPSVSLFAKTLLQGDLIQYSGDPLQDFTLMRFLDRFVFRNPKPIKRKQNTDTSVLQPKQRSHGSSLAVNSEEFLRQEESQIPVDQIFFYRFFKKRQQENAHRRPKIDNDNESLEDVDDDEFEKMLDSCEGDSYFTELPDKDLDFAGKDADESDESDESGDLDDEEVSLGSMNEEDFGEEVGGEGGTFMGDEDEDGKERFVLLLRKIQIEQVTNSIFCGLLDDNAGAKIDNIGLNAMANTDKAGVKQLKWESQRDDWIHDRDAKTLRRKKAAFNKRKRFGRGVKTTTVMMGNKRKRK